MYLGRVCFIRKANRMTKISKRPKLVGAVLAFFTGYKVKDSYYAFFFTYRGQKINTQLPLGA